MGNTTLKEVKNSINMLQKENEEVKILWNVMIQSNREIKARKPDIVVVKKNERSCVINDIAIPGDIRERKN